MQKINWKVRFRNKVWVAGFISQTLLLIQAVIFGLEGLHVIDIDLERAEDGFHWLLGIADLILAYLAYLGIIVDPTTEGFTDSVKVMHREESLSEAAKKMP